MSAVFGCALDKAFMYTLVTLLLTQATLGQLLTLQPYSQPNSTDCKDGVIEKNDSVTFYGTANMQTTTRLLLLFEAKPVGGSYGLICTADINTQGCIQLGSNEHCYCYQEAGNTYSVVYNDTATRVYSGADFRINWPAARTKSVVQTMPTVHEQGKVNLKLNEKEQNVESDCKLTFPINDDNNTIEFCVHGLENPHLSVEIGGHVTTQIGNCTSRTFQVDKQDLGTHFNFSYSEPSGCERKRTVSCKVLEGHTSSVGFSTWAIVLIVIFGVACCGLVIAGVYFICTKTSKGRSTWIIIVIFGSAIVCIVVVIVAAVLG